MGKEKDSTLAVDVLAKAITVPGVKVNREEFLVNVFKKEHNGVLLLLLRHCSSLCLH